MVSESDVSVCLQQKLQSIHGEIFEPHQNLQELNSMKIKPTRLSDKGNFKKL